ncbi:MAG: outer membrane protein assembly factor BamE [Gemmataceae bacterium]|nr:outer membrane protein assembly factor BamE [Gemmataceae bacterium]MCI0743445.1 outer membrane protein assembly factor BamE [Gemmataceae bacterium]
MVRIWVRIALFFGLALAAIAGAYLFMQWHEGRLLAAFEANSEDLRHKVAQVQLGMTKHDVQAILGEPTGRGASAKPRG